MIPARGWERAGAFVVGLLVLVGAALAESPAQPMNARPEAEPPPAATANGHGTYRWLRREVFPLCMYCHISVPGVSFGRYQDVIKHVVPGDPENSRLYVMVATRRMPKGRGGLPEEQISAIREWISRGAQND